MKPVVVVNTPRADAAEIAKLAKLGVATTHEALGRTGLMKPYMRPIWPGAQIAGSAVTVLTQPGDNWMIHVAVEQCQARRRPRRRGDPPTMPTACSAIFSHLRHGARRRRSGDRRRRARRRRAERDGLSRLVAAISARGTVKETFGSVNVPVVCAGALVKPGDVIVADDDGVAVVPRREVGAAVKAGEARIANEAAKRAQLAAGALSLDLYEMREGLEKGGLRYVEYREETEAGNFSDRLTPAFPA